MKKYVVTLLMLFLCLAANGQKFVEKIKSSPLMVLTIDESVFLDASFAKGLEDRSLKIKSIHISKDRVVSNYLMSQPGGEVCEIVTMVSNIIDKSPANEEGAFWLYFNNGAMKLSETEEFVALDFYSGNRDRKLSQTHVAREYKFY